MSRDTREWAWKCSTSRGNARLVLLSIADRIPDEQCVAWASLTSLMKRTNASRNAVRGAITALAEAGELEVLDDLDGPQHSTVYRLPRAAAWLAKVAAARKVDPEAYVDPPAESDPVPALDIERLRKHGIWPKTGSESDPRREDLTGSKSAPPRQNLTPPRVKIRPPSGSEPDPQNRSEPKVNRRYSSSSAADLTSAADWQVDDASLFWAQQQGHLARLGEHGLQAADAKWRHHRGTWSPRPTATWAADWRAWIAREHSPTPQRPHLYALPGGTPAPQTGMTRADAHMAALLAAVDEPTGTE
ncbi:MULTISPECIES: helix-turn-helix domain-containing protein [Streptomyces]|uniref:Helix-turn-helix domain-containing protein n=1 Tax=Streptomyces dengpaensis TaxID=2049881 RepID=A0ABN5I1Y8_9ACTN|nr:MULTISPECIES: helix-turn-helix domain-containing protein [Streptomyces]AVH55622.1 helix-turn-helix domain-containing protein [Streptomyces dengpaensis]PIB11883.1 helix-turn-helix domain-containing protein [Streptomyces sp. HG99]